MGGIISITLHYSLLIDLIIVIMYASL